MDVLPLVSLLHRPMQLHLVQVVADLGDLVNELSSV